MITRTGVREEMIRRRFDGVLRDRARTVIGRLERLLREHEARVLGHEIDEPVALDEEALGDAAQLAILGRIGDES